MPKSNAGTDQGTGTDGTGTDQGTGNNGTGNNGTGNNGTGNNGTGAQDKKGTGTGNKDTPPAPSVTGTRHNITSSLYFDIDSIMNDMNKYRKLHGVVNLIFDTRVSESAQRHANRMADTSNFAHSSDNNYGENIFMSGKGRAAPTNVTQYINTSTRLFYEEVSLYDWSNPRFAKGTGHFTQLVWASTTHVGVGVAYNNGGVYVCVQYNPPGNYSGRFGLNVKPLVR